MTMIRLPEMTTDLSVKSTDELKEMLTRLLEVSASNLVECARIIEELENRGENLSELRLSIVGYLRKISCGQLLPGLVVQLQCTPEILGRVASLPIQDQQKILDNPSIEVYSLGDGEPEKRLVAVHELSPSEARQVFSDHVRTREEQVSYLKSRTINGPVHQPAKPTFEIREKGVYVNAAPCMISWARLKRIVATHSRS